MNGKELNELIRKLNIFNDRYKTKVVYQVNIDLEDEDECIILSAQAFGFINHGKKYELIDFSVIDRENINTTYELNEVEDFTNYTDKHCNIIEILNDYLQVPQDRVKEFCDVTCCEEYNSDYVYDDDIILSDMVILSEKRIIDKRAFEGFYSTFFGKYIEKSEYEKFLGEKSRQRSLTDDLLRLIEDKGIEHVNYKAIRTMLESINEEYDFNEER